MTTTTKHPVTEKLFNLIKKKETNLGAVADVHTQEELFRLIKAIGPHICVLKTHIDILRDFDTSVPDKLRSLADQHNFLLFEDRKFCDIGSISQQQYAGGIYRIAEWADITNAYVTPGPGIVEGLAEIGLPKQRGLLLIGELSSKGSLAQGSYTEAAIKIAQQYPEFVMGFITQNRLLKDKNWVHMTPGVQLAPGGDHLGQQYRTPHQAIATQGNDIILVGRGIYGQPNPAEAALTYRRQAWTAHLSKNTQTPPQNQ